MKVVFMTVVFMYVCLNVLIFRSRLKQKVHKIDIHIYLVWYNENKWYIHIDGSKCKRHKIKKAIEEVI